MDFFLNIIVDLDYSGILYSFPQGGSGVTCPPLCALVAPSFAISSRDLLLAGSLFDYPCVVFGRLLWDI